MTKENPEQKQKGAAEEGAPDMGCCSPQKFMEMMSRCCEGKKCDCSAMMQEMMKGGPDRPESQ